MSLTASFVSDVYSGTVVKEPLGIVDNVTTRDGKTACRLHDDKHWCYCLLGSKVNCDQICNGQILKLVSYTLEWSHCIRVEHPVILIDAAAVVVSHNKPDFNTFSIYNVIPASTFPLTTGILTDIVTCNITSNKFLLDTPVLQVVSLETRNNIRAAVISDGTHFIHAKLDSRVPQLTLYGLYHITRWQCTKFETINFFQIYECKLNSVCIDIVHHVSNQGLPLISSLKVSSSANYSDDRVSLLTHKFISTLFDDCQATITSVTDEKFKNPTLQIIQLSGHNAYVSDGVHYWRAAFAESPLLHQLGKYDLINVKYYEQLILPECKDYRSLFIYDWYLVSSASSIIGKPQSIITSSTQHHLQLTSSFVSDCIVRHKQVVDPVVQISHFYERKDCAPLLGCTLFDGNFTVNAVFNDGDIHAQEYDIIKLNTYDCTNCYTTSTFTVTIHNYVPCFSASGLLMPDNIGVRVNGNSLWEQQYSFINNLGCWYNCSINSSHTIKLRITRRRELNGGTVVCDGIDSNGDSIGIKHHCTDAQQLRTGQVYAFVQPHLAMSSKHF